MKNKLRKVRVKKTGREIWVYKLLRREGFADFADCKTEYADKDLVFIVE